MSIDRETIRIWRKIIRKILNEEWDPIGGCPPDEYDVYRDGLIKMIDENASDDELIAYLDLAVSKRMGFGRTDPEHSRRVVASIRSALRASC
jgi:hypothetical protein